jgi:hypothetical protein
VGEVNVLKFIGFLIVAFFALVLSVCAGVLGCLLTVAMLHAGFEIRVPQKHFILSVTASIIAGIILWGCYLPRLYRLYRRW